MIRMVAFDADDTLWHTERLFLDTQRRFRELLARHTDPASIEQQLYDTEMRNLAHYGYGVKSFTLSMVETAIDLSRGDVTGGEIRQILRLGREMLLAPVELIDGVREVVEAVAETRPLMLLPKGDLLDQETKLARSGIGDLFSVIEIVSRKDRTTYEGVIERHGLEPHEFAMIGDSLRSDVLPVASMGGHAIHVPASTTWAHEEVSRERMDHVSFHTAATIRDVPDLLASPLSDSGHDIPKPNAGPSGGEPAPRL